MPGRDDVFARRKEFAKAHNLPYWKVRRILPDTMRQLENCKNEEAIRLILTSRIAKKPPKRETGE